MRKFQEIIRQLIRNLLFNWGFLFKEDCLNLLSMILDRLIFRLFILGSLVFLLALRMKIKLVFFLKIIFYSNLIFFWALWLVLIWQRVILIVSPLTLSLLLITLLILIFYQIFIRFDFNYTLRELLVLYFIIPKLNTFFQIKRIINCFSVDNILIDNWFSSIKLSHTILLIIFDAIISL